VDLTVGHVNITDWLIDWLRGTENTDQVWRESILCGWTIHTEQSVRVPEKDWLYSDF